MRVHINSDDREGGTDSSFTINLATLSQYTKGMNRFAVESVDVPYSFWKIRANLSNEAFRVKYFDNSTKLIKYVNHPVVNVSIGNPNITDIISAMKAQMDNGDVGNLQTFTISVDSIHGLLVITSTHNFSLDFTVQRYAGNVIGFREDLYDSFAINGVQTIYSPTVIDLVPDKHLYLKSSLNTVGDYISETKRVENVICKIPVVGSGVVEFGLINYQPYHLDWKPLPELSGTVSFELVDMNNNPVDLHEVPFGFTLILG